jgi:hypothetical protein
MGSYHVLKTDHDTEKGLYVRGLAWRIPIDFWEDHLIRRISRRSVWVGSPFYRGSWKLSPEDWTMPP